MTNHFDVVHYYVYSYILLDRLVCIGLFFLLTNGGFVLLGTFFFCQKPYTMFLKVTNNLLLFEGFFIGYYDN